MDLSATIQNLYAEKQRLEQVIAALEELQSSSTSVPYHVGGKRRGRKFMGQKEREEVSQRMKRYWASQRKQRKKQEESA